MPILKRCFFHLDLMTFYFCAEPNAIKVFVLDEADEMLSRGFKDQIYDVFKNLPAEVQVILLSATMPSDVMEVTQHFMRNPIRILVRKEELTLEGIKQFHVQVGRDVLKLYVRGSLPDLGFSGTTRRIPA